MLNLPNAAKTLYAIKQLLSSVINKYNTPTHYKIIEDSLTVPCGTVHRLSYTVLGGIVDVTVDGDTIAVPVGVSATFPATTLLSKEITITSATSNDIVYVTTMN